MENRTPASPKLGTREETRRSTGRAGLALVASVALHALLFAATTLTPGLIPPPTELQVDEGIAVEVVDAAALGRRLPIRADSIPIAAANPEGPPASTAPAPPGPDAAQAAPVAPATATPPQEATAPAQDTPPPASEAASAARDFAQAAPPIAGTPALAPPPAPMQAPDVKVADLARLAPAAETSPMPAGPAAAPLPASAPLAAAVEPGGPAIEASPDRAQVAAIPVPVDAGTGVSVGPSLEPAQARPAEPSASSVAAETPAPAAPTVVTAAAPPVVAPLSAAPSGPEARPAPAPDRTFQQAALSPEPARPNASPPRAPPADAPTSLAVVAPPATLRPIDPKEAVEAALGTLECARVSAKVDPLVGTVSLKGHARSEADRLRLAREIGALAGVQRVDDAELRVLGEPYCRLLAFLDRPEFSRSTEQRQDLTTVGVTNQPGMRRIAGGEPLQLTLSSPEFDSFLYVDHFSADGKVTHLLPTDRPDNFLKADTVFRLGPGERGRRAIAVPPYGLDVIVVLASSEPLFVRPRPISEDAAGYLATLDERIRALKASRLSLRYEYAYYLVQTEPPRATR